MRYDDRRELFRRQVYEAFRGTLKPDKSRKGFICPICGSGDGPNGTGITENPRSPGHYTCWAGCFKNADAFEIDALINGLQQGTWEAMRHTYDLCGVGYDKSDEREARSRDSYRTESVRTIEDTQADIHNTAYTKEQTGKAEERDYLPLYREANKHVGETTYHRGLSRETLDKFLIGYTPSYSWENRLAQGWSALIIPTSRGSYVIRNTDPDAESGDRYRKQGPVHIFNQRALDADKPVFVVEGELDALSIIEVGGEAVGLGSTSTIRALLATLETNRPKHPLLLALDKDEAGNRGTAELAAGLDRLRIPYYIMDITGPDKDANAVLMKDRERLRQAVAEGENIEAAILEAERDKLEKEAAVYSLPDFIRGIEESKTAPFTPTGFEDLDTVLDGGLYAGLYVIGAISSLGKTTFCLQVADNIAAAGRDVLIFSLEMAREELIAKSISRLTLLLDLEENGGTKNAKSTRGILTGTRYKNYSQVERGLIERAVSAYGEYAGRLYITQGIGDVGVTQIREKVERHIKLTGRPPVVVIDYLQILAPADPRATDKQNTDKAVLELKRLSRDCKISILGISSFNRDNYTAPVNLASFKESGAIEYSSDVLLGMQYDGMDYREGEAEKAREKRIRTLVKEAITAAKGGEPQAIQVKVLKNRNGSKGEAILSYYPMFNFFTKGERATDDWTKDADAADWSESEGDYK